MSFKEAIETRISRRKYLPTPIKTAFTEQINRLIKEYNQKENLNIQLVTDNGDAFNNLKKSYGLLSGVQNYIALVGKKSDKNAKEKLGYYGELLVLEATKMGLGTCWVGLTFDKEACACEVNFDESLDCIIAIGNIAENLSIKENLIQKASHFKSKVAKDLYKVDDNPSSRFIEAMHYVQKAPSGKNKMPFLFQYRNGDTSVSITDTTGYEYIDLGIAKLHFEIGAGGGNWSWGNNGKFQYS